MSECGASAILLPGGPAAVPFQTCCVFAVLRASGGGPVPAVACRAEPAAPLVRSGPAGEVPR